MDVMIKDGDMVLDSTGRPVCISGIDEVLQRVKLTLSTKKGEFIYNKSFGCETPCITHDKRTLRNVEAQLREAIVNIPCAQIELLSAEMLEEGLRVTFDLTYGKENVRSELVVK